MHNKKPVVFVGLSGGVDSSVSAYLLKKKYEVVGVFIRTWTPDFAPCTWRAERTDAMRVAASLDIPFLECDLEEEYKKGVADYMIAEYRAGRTPNPDVMCNKEVKFGGFLKWALKQGANFVATGHYAQISERGLALKSEAGKGRSSRRNLSMELGIMNYELQKGIDPTKDQSYFLWTLNQKQLSRILFPVGHLKKSQVRVLAKKAGLPTAEKKDSQGICFLGMLDMKDFLKHYIKEKKGNVVNEKGEVIGIHQGAVFHTLGERHGFTIFKKSPHDSPYYVVAKDIKKNTITVSAEPTHNHSQILKNLRMEDCNWITGVPEINKKYTAQIRYHGTQESCEVEELKGKTAILNFKNPQLVSPGQSIVLYDRDLCLGGGVVQ